MYLIAFAVMHFIFIVKFFLAEIIEDEPAWVTEDAENVANRVSQVSKDNKDKKLIEYLSKHYSEVDLLFTVLKKQHKDLLMSSQLIYKIHDGCKEWLAKNE